MNKIASLLAALALSVGVQFNALAVDATDITRHIFRVKEQIPVQGGDMTLLYPKWLPGNHSPTGRVDAVAGLVITANGTAPEIPLGGKMEPIA